MSRRDANLFTMLQDHHLALLSAKWSRMQVPTGTKHPSQGNALGTQRWEFGRAEGPIHLQYVHDLHSMFNVSGLQPSVTVSPINLGRCPRLRCFSPVGLCLRHGKDLRDQGILQRCEFSVLFPQNIKMLVPTDPTGPQRRSTRW